MSSQKRDIETIAAEANSRGFVVNNLFQLDGGKVWRANMRRATGAETDKDFTCFAVGENPSEALEAALRQLPKEEAPAAEDGAGLLE